MSDLPVLSRGALGDIAALCARGIRTPPSIDELDVALFGHEQPAIVRGDPHVGIVATVRGEQGAHVRILVVDPNARGKGEGHHLVEAAEFDARELGLTSVTTGADAPFYLWPGVPITETALLCLFESHGYARIDTAFDMRVDLAAIPDDPGGHALATAADRDEFDAWITTHWANWRPEALRALDKGNLVLVRGNSGIDAFCAFEVSRVGFLGPVASRPDLLGKGRGRPALLGALHELHRRGRTVTNVCWVGPIRPYAEVGGEISNVYFVLRRNLK
jgi:GNAT superfamily N-acetyltransferase